MKYYLGEINTYIGEISVSTMVKFKTIGDPAQKLDALASNFWGEGAKRDFDTGYYDFGDKVAGIGCWQEVQKKTFMDLSIIVELFR